MSGKSWWLIFLCFASCSTVHSVAPGAKSISDFTAVAVIEIQEMKFQADSFFGDRENMTSRERPADPKFQQWARQAIDRVNRLLPDETRLANVTIKLVFDAWIRSKGGLAEQVPISIIESYQEPKTQSIRLGMAELKNDKLSFQLTVAHEYSHLIFESESRKARTTPSDADRIEFWPKSVYEGVADLIMSLGLDSNLTAAPQNWSSRRLDEYQSLAEARTAVDQTVPRAKEAFQRMGLIPKYKIYAEWLVSIDRFIQSMGGVDPYAEGRWLAGTLRKVASTPAKKKQLIEVLLALAREGKSTGDAQAFLDDVIAKLSHH